MKRIVVLLSGRGSNLRALVEADLPLTIAAVIANRPDAAGLAFAAQHGIASQVVEHTTYASREAFDAALGDAIEAQRADLVVMAGFMRLLTPGFIRRFAGRMVNIHPALLPAFTGLDTHRRALERGCRVHGCTVHYVTEGMDEGPIIAQATVPVLPDDDEDTLAARVLAEEHRLYPAVLRAWCAGDFGLEGDAVAWRGGRTWPGAAHYPAC
ncbi:MAG: phosphoribosylglycinamide formyltransferase [Rhodocyclaceae bacterium]|nr:phosphoribosylglycinamide formyltransferase [Rhodocyclaceae bacterium]